MARSYWRTAWRQGRGKLRHSRTRGVPIPNTGKGRGWGMPKHFDCFGSCEICDGVSRTRREREAMKTEKRAY